MPEICFLEEGVLSPIGFRATGVSCGLKVGGFKDISLLISETPCNAAMAFTSSRIQGAHIAVDKERFGNKIRAILVNSGNANCLTGQEGVNNAYEMLKITEEVLGIAPGECLLASTGAIGLPLNMTRIRYGIERLGAIIGSESNIRNFCSGIMTTDTRQKNIACEFDLDGVKVRIGATAKGANMIKPDLQTMHATLLCFITTDVSISKELLSHALSESLPESLNRICIDNDLSPNDSVFLLANGMAENEPIISDQDPRYDQFLSVLKTILVELGKVLIKNGLGVTKMIHLQVKGAADSDQAEKLVRAIAESYQFKAAVFGQHSGWQKILTIISYSGVDFDLNSVEIKLNDLVLFNQGKDNSAAISSAHAEMVPMECTIIVNLNQGTADSFLWTSDLSFDYLKINSHFPE